ncbi:MAG: L-serine ammonia-lyase [Rubripirellula sp.]
MAQPPGSPQALSVFDMFKIGVGPSSSHTMGPWRAAQRFVNEKVADRLAEVVSVTVDLYGSLAKTGRGHGTDVAVQLGLGLEDPETIDVSTMEKEIERIATTKRLDLGRRQPVTFDPHSDLVFHFKEQLAGHPNALRFTAAFNGGDTVSAVYYSIGGGFVVEEHESNCKADYTLPFPIATATELQSHCASESLRIADVVWQNERSWRSEEEIRLGLKRIRDAMFQSIVRGCRTEGVLPGGLNVHRRAAPMARRLLGHAVPNEFQGFLEAMQSEKPEFPWVLDWVSCFALAVNEENAAFGRIVTAPTNGAAGVIPAVMAYAKAFCSATEGQCDDFLLTAGEIGCIFKKGATISAALGGCQAEIGVSSAMAAAALTELLGGAATQATEAAEIAMEHHLGMTCDPIGGLVQVPCIERNAMGAIKAISAAQLALHRDPAKACVTLDDVVRTMWETARDMNAKYKETSEGGLAVQIPVNVIEC